MSGKIRFKQVEGLQELADSVARTGDLGLAAFTNNYQDLNNLPPLGSASALNSGVGGNDVIIGSDVRLEDDRFPLNHNFSHNTGQNDFIHPTGIGAVPQHRQILAGSGITGGGNLENDLTISLTEEILDKIFNIPSGDFLESGSNISLLVNDVGYLTTGDLPPSGDFLQSGDNVSSLANDAGYINSGDLPDTGNLVPNSRQILTNSGITGGGNLDGDLFLGLTEEILDQINNAGSSINWVFSDSNYQASSFDGIMADSSTGSFTIDFDPFPSLGDEIVVCDYKSTFSTNPVNVHSTSKIAGFESGISLDVDNSFIKFVFSNSGEGWRIANLLTGEILIDSTGIGTSGSTFVKPFRSVFGDPNYTFQIQDIGCFISMDSSTQPFETGFQYFILPLFEELNQPIIGSTIDFTTFFINGTTYITGENSSVVINGAVGNQLRLPTSVGTVLYRGDNSWQLWGDLT